jgi:hypothetical protein
LRKSQILVLLFLLFFSACQKSENVNPEAVKSSNARVEGGTFMLRYENLHPDVRVSIVRYNNEGGYLEFSDPYIFEKLKTELTNKSSQELSNWEKQFEGFTSIRSVYEQAINSETERAKVTTLLYGDKTPKSVMQDTTRTDFVNKNRKSLIFETYGIFKMNLANYNIAPFLNADGIVKIANYFIQYTQNQIKILKNTDSSKLDLLKKAKQSDDEVTVLPITIHKSSSQSNGRAEETEATGDAPIYIGGFPYTCASNGNMHYELNQNDYQSPIYTIIGYSYDYFSGQYFPILQITGYDPKTSITASMYTEGCHFIHGWTLVNQYQKTITIENTRCDTYYYTQVQTGNHTSNISMTAYDGVRINKYSGANPCFSNVTGRFENWAFTANPYGQNYIIKSLQII